MAESSPDLLTEEDYQTLKGLGPNGTQLDLYDSDDSTVDEFPGEEDPVFKVALQGTDKVALIDSTDKWKVVGRYWVLNHRGYAMETNTNVFLHHVIKGVPEGELVVDHINTDRLDNRAENLRIVTKSENSRNQSHKKTPPKGKSVSQSRSRFPGVGYMQDRMNFRVRIKIDGSRVFLGYFEDEQLAAFVFAVETIRIDPLIWYREWDSINIEML